MHEESSFLHTRSLLSPPQASGSPFMSSAPDFLCLSSPAVEKSQTAVETPAIPFSPTTPASATVAASTAAQDAKVLTTLQHELRQYKQDMRTAARERDIAKSSCASARSDVEQLQAVVARLEEELAEHQQMLRTVRESKQVQVNSECNDANGSSRTNGPVATASMSITLESVSELCDHMSTVNTKESTSTLCVLGNNISAGRSETVSVAPTVPAKNRSCWRALLQSKKSWVKLP